MTEGQPVRRSTPIDDILAASGGSNGTTGPTLASPVLGAHGAMITPTAQPDPPLSTGIRSANWLLIVFMVALFAVLFPGILVPMLSVGGKFTTGQPVPVGLRVGLVIWLALGLYVMYRAIRVRLVVTDDALLIFNPVHTYRLPWAVIDYVEIRKIYTNNHTPTAKVRVHPRQGEMFDVASANVNYRTRTKTLEKLYTALAANDVQLDDSRDAGR